GAQPQSRLTMDAAGNLYGTTSQDGRFCSYGPCGTVFELLAATRKLKVLHSFCDGFDCRDGKAPTAGLTMDASGNLYGTTTAGGGNDLDDQNGGGVIYKIDTAGKFSVLYRFCAKRNCTDGDGPAGELMLDAAGHLYGTTRAGGAHNQGVAFELLSRN
ncbi:MAG TPA: choice-of-anchor tandem repeat GloVer-containing protein, partial [Rhizomicrobium sp.]